MTTGQVVRLLSAPVHCSPLKLISPIPNPNVPPTTGMGTIEIEVVAELTFRRKLNFHNTLAFTMYGIDSTSSTSSI